MKPSQTKPSSNENNNNNWKYRPSLFNYLIGDNKAWFMTGFTTLFIACWRLMETTSTERLFTWQVYVIVFPLMILSIFALIVIRTIKSLKVEYELSDDRIFIREGALGFTCKVLNRSDIRKIQINSSLVQRLFNTGTIRFYIDTKETDIWTGVERNYEEWDSVRDPKSVVEMLTKIKVYNSGN